MDWSTLKTECRSKLNRVYFSHWDQDHIGFLKRAHQILSNLCIAAMPGGDTKSPRKLNLFKAVPFCQAQDPLVHELKTPVSQLPKASNDSSRVFLLRKRNLVPGDSSQKQEAEWSKANLNLVDSLILGHHGSRTSTSPTLLKRLVNLKIAIASARKSRYGHPHKETNHKLKEHGVSVLSTNDWGTIQLPEN